MMHKNPDICPACGGRLDFWFIKKTPYGNYQIKRCNSCRSAFTMPRPGREEIMALYGSVPESDAEERYEQAVQKETNNPSLTIDGARIARHVRKMANGVRFLDVGAGDGWHAKAADEAGFRVTALEPNPVVRRVFKKITGFEAKAGYLDDDFVRSNRCSYDVVLLSQVFEHLPDIERAARHVHQLLAPGGVAAIAVPLFRSWLSLLTGKRDMFISPPEHLNYFTAAGIRRLMEPSGFELVHFETVTWFTPERVVAKVGSRVLGWPAVAGLKVFFPLANRAKRGNFLEAYFRRKRESTFHNGNDAKV